MFTHKLSRMMKGMSAQSAFMASEVRQTEIVQWAYQEGLRDLAQQPALAAERRPLREVRAEAELLVNRQMFNPIKI